MAQVLADDYDGTISTDKTPVMPWVVTFGAQSDATVCYIDLTTANFEALAAALEPFTSKANKTEEHQNIWKKSTSAASAATGTRTPRSSTGTATQEPGEGTKAKTWAETSGWKDKDGNAPKKGGRASVELLSAYRAAVKDAPESI